MSILRDGYCKRIFRVLLNPWPLLYINSKGEYTKNFPKSSTYAIAVVNFVKKTFPDTYLEIAKILFLVFDNFVSHTIDKFLKAGRA